MCFFHILTLSVLLSQSRWRHFGHLINWYILQGIQARSVTVLKGLKHQTLTRRQSAACECHLYEWIFPFDSGSTLSDDFSAWVGSMDGQESTVSSELHLRQPSTKGRAFVVRKKKLGLMIAANRTGVLSVYSV